MTFIYIFIHSRRSISSEIPEIFFFLVTFSGVTQTLWRIQGHSELILNGSSKEMVSNLWNIGGGEKLKTLITLINLLINSFIHIIYITYLFIYIISQYSEHISS